MNRWKKCKLKSESEKRETLMINVSFEISKEYYVYPRILQERSEARNLVLKLSDKITLNLERSTVLADNIHFVTSTKDLHEVEMVDTSDIQQSIYHDTHYQSSVAVRQKDGNVEVEGIINDHLRIRPLPERERSGEGQMMHKIFEVEPLKGEFSRAGEIVRVNDVSKHTNSDGMQHLNNLQSRASNVEQFQVELHLISDKAHQKYYNKNQELITYLAVMTNAANLRYLEMGNPKVKFLLVGVTRAKDHDFARNNGREIDAGEMLGGLEHYKKEGRIPGKFDVVYLVTGLDMTKIANGRKSNGILGRAYMSTVCSHMAMGEGEDTALSYNGVDTLAHELAHTLGSPHDETPECPWADGYLMSYVDGGLRKFRLSPCSQKSIRQYVRKQSEECIRVLNGHNFLKDENRFPGQTIRAQFFCKKQLKQDGQRRQRQKLIVKQDGNCKIDCCHRFAGYMTCTKYPMLDGMKCQPGKTCRRGVCGSH
ncbi:venom metalloproteinase antarease-like TtrivMP_A isoform X4 [Rhipicephalus microplus]|uniref:venom metalloproteinase antarease-like TtrivMP_A isoform X4 n=1 Tax=Rhipicephalus microplus TaxID=6941 RepID=UPI003F6BDD40